MKVSFFSSSFFSRGNTRRVREYCVSTISTFEPVNQFSRNIVYICRWRSRKPVTQSVILARWMQELGATLAGLNIRDLKLCMIVDLRKICNFYSGNYFVECKTATWHTELLGFRTYHRQNPLESTSSMTVSWRYLAFNLNIKEGRRLNYKRFYKLCMKCCLWVRNEASVAVVESLNE